MKISAVIPCYGAPQTLKELHDRLVQVFVSMKCQYEIVFVNDSCPRGSWIEIQKICALDSNTKGINFVRNFGQHSAIAAGLSVATGDWVTVMDCDLQDDPAYIPQLYKTAQGGYDVVLAARVQRQERVFKRLQSYLFYKFLNLFLGVKMNSQVGNYGLYSRRAIDATHTLHDRVRFFPFLISWLKFPTTQIEITQNKRDEGTSSYTFKKALQLAFDVALASSNRPLLWSVQLGALCSAASFLFVTVFIARFFLYGLAPSGWTSLIVSIFFSTGLVLMNLGILGLYISRLNDQVLGRPIYIISDKLNF